MAEYHYHEKNFHLLNFLNLFTFNLENFKLNLTYSPFTFDFLKHICNYSQNKIKSPEKQTKRGFNKPINSRE